MVYKAVLTLSVVVSRFSIHFKRKVSPSLKLGSDSLSRGYYWDIFRNYEKIGKIRAPVLQPARSVWRPSHNRSVCSRFKGSAEFMVQRIAETRKERVAHGQWLRRRVLAEVAIMHGTADEVVPCHNGEAWQFVKLLWLHSVSSNSVLSSAVCHMYCNSVTGSSEAAQSFRHLTVWSGQNGRRLLRPSTFAVLDARIEDSRGASS